MQKFIRLPGLLFIVLLCSCSNNSIHQISPDTVANTSVTKGNITWIFDGNYTIGQFATGDYYVVAPSGLTITNISAGGNETLGGTELNPTVGTTTQGLIDNSGCSYCAEYSSTLNVGDNLPLSLSAGDMIVTATEYDYYGVVNPNQSNEKNYTWVQEAAILTVLSSAPAANSFRPALADPNRTIYSTDDINYDLLADLTPVSGIMSLSTAADMVARPWIDWVGGYMGRQIHPNNNMKDYGGEISVDTGTIALILNCNYTDEQKRPIAIGYIQIGLDFYYNAKALRNRYGLNVAHNVGRKLPVLLAGELLDLAEIKAIWSKTGSYLHSSPGSYPSDAWFFSEDQGIEYVTSYDVSQTAAGSATYTPDVDYTISEIGMPEWFHYPYSSRGQSTAHWEADNYRLCCYSGTLEGAALTSHIMGLRTTWNNQAFFDYIDRFVAIADGEEDPFGYTVTGEAPGYRGSWQSDGGWMSSMFDTYRDYY